MSNESGRVSKTVASWFPGHMAAGLRELREAADLIDVVLEVRDARLPRTSAVASLHRRLQNKPAIVLLNRQDLAEPAATRAWLAKLASEGVTAFAVTGTRSASLSGVRAALNARPERRIRTRVAVVGAPNTGKSSVINALARRKRNVVQNKAGVTKHLRWIRLDDRVDMLDTPGVLEPRISKRTAAWQLALCGILPESAFDAEDVVEQFSAWVALKRPSAAASINLEAFASRRGMLRRRGEIDRLNAARAFLKEFRAGKLGRFSFELAEERQ